MSTRESGQYREIERILTIALIAAAAVFLLFLLAAGFGVVWLKITTAVILVLLSGLALVSLYLTGELRRLRSRYLVFGFAALLVCTLLSLLLNYPSPAPVPLDPNAATTMAPMFRL